jgi:AraC family transcriptional regulator of arabinose operon
MEQDEIHMRLRFELTPATDQKLPLFIESVGHNNEQEKIVRDAGYPFYHWIQTIEGEGYITFEGKTQELPIGTGVLLLPYVSHAYEAAQSHWSTQYLTFDGNMVQDILLLIGLNKSAVYRWGIDTPLELAIHQILRRIEFDPDLSGLYASADLYQFLMTLKRYGHSNNKLPLSDTLNKLQPLLDWFETDYMNPDIGLNEMAEQLQFTPRHLNTLFRIAFGISPYAYLIALRIRKSKELLLRNPTLPVHLITVAAGFRDASHFIATFRQYVGFTPERFRELN